MKKLKSTSCSDLLTLVDLKTLEHRRYSRSLVLCHKCMYNVGSRKCFYCVGVKMTLEVFGSSISLPIILDTCLGHKIT